MNLNAVSNIRTIGTKNNTNFKARVRDVRCTDTFVKTNNQEDLNVSYPQVLRYSPANLKRKRVIQAEMEKESKYTQIKRQKQEAVKAKFDKLNDEINYLFDEICSITDGGLTCMRGLYKLARDKYNNPHEKKIYALAYLNHAKMVQYLASEIERLQKRIEEMRESGELEFAEISDESIALSQENIDFYKNMSDFIPKDLVEEK